MDLPLYTTVSRTELSDLGSADYHLFDKAIVLVRQAGVDTEQQLFRDLLLRLRRTDDGGGLETPDEAVVGATTPFAEALHLFATASDATSTSCMPVASLSPCSKLSTMVQGYI